MQDASDEVMNPMEGLTVVKATAAYLTESREAKMDRLRLNQINRDAYNNIQDYSYKIEGQSKEFIPRTFQTVEQFSAFIKKSMMQFEDWFSVEAPKGSVLSPESIRGVMHCFLDNLPMASSTVSFIQRFTDGCKVGLMESEMVFKIHGSRRAAQKYKLERGKLVEVEQNPWRLEVDLVRNEDFFSDPSGNGLYNIHRSQRDLHVVQELAEEGIYDKEVVKLITSDMVIPDEDKREDTVEDEGTRPSFRKQVVLDECWGTLLNEDGSVYKKNVFWTVANEKYLIRKPQTFPFWHGEDPFIRIPLIRKPFSDVHNALYDQVVPLNNALNELFNLMLDGGLASVWGIKQIRLDYLEDSRQVADGIPQGKTLAVAEDAPEGAKVLEQVTEGNIPPDALNMYTILDRETNSAALSNEIRQGILPSKAVKATEINSAEQNSAVLLDGIINDMEKEMSRLLRKVWLTILQNADELAADELAQHMNTREMFALARMTPAERYNMFSGCKLKVYGLSATLSRGRDFQKIMAILQVAQQSPLLLPVLMRRVSGDKLWMRLLQLANLNGSDLEMSEDDAKNMPFDLGIAMAMIQRQGGSQTSPTGEAGLQSDIQQTAGPTNGL